MGSAAYEKVKYRMKAIGLKLEDHVKSEINSWYNGFRFIPKDMKAFILALLATQRFCRDADDISGLGIGGRVQGVGTLSLREVGDPGHPGMHVLIRKGEPCKDCNNQKGYGVVEYCEIHVDSVSPAGGTTNGGKCYYRPDLIGEHAAVDLKHWKIILPDREGTRLGVRF